MSADLQFYFLKRHGVFKQIQLIEGCNQSFLCSINWALGMHIENRRDHKTQRELYETSDHLSEPPSSTNDSDQLGVDELKLLMVGVVLLLIKHSLMHDVRSSQSMLFSTGRIK